MRRDLLHALVGSVGMLAPPHAQQMTVAPQQAIPGNLRFGPASPNQLSSSGFSGAVAGPSRPQVFQEQQFPQPSPAGHPVAAALSATAAPSPGHFNGAPPHPPHPVTPVTPAAAAPTQGTSPMPHYGQPEFRAPGGLTGGLAGGPLPASTGGVYTSPLFTAANVLAGGAPAITQLVTALGNRGGNLHRYE